MPPRPLTVAIARSIASGGGCGYVPFAPGTVASAATLLPGAILLHVAPALLPAVAVAIALLGLWAIAAARVDGDPGWVVIDEVAGQLLAMCSLASLTLPGVAASFLVFRLLDVTKPGAVGWADRQRGARGIMADDVIAGGITAGILWAVQSQWPAAFAF